MPRVATVVVGFVVLGTVAALYAHHERHGVFSPIQASIAFFLVLNFLISMWEICLFLRIRLIEKQYNDFKKTYKGRELRRVLDLFLTRITWAQVFQPSTWAEIWSSYSIFDESYADQRSFGFFIDVGNGFSMLIPSLVGLIGMTYFNARDVAIFDAVPYLRTALSDPVVFGVLLLVSNYQMWYGTVIYFTSYIVNRRFRGHSVLNVVAFVGISNLLWVVFPMVAMYAGFVTVYNRNFDVFV